ncbi:hypothetical protein STEG23_000523 [Scotinomys teguina]
MSRARNPWMQKPRRQEPRGQDAQESPVQEPYSFLPWALRILLGVRSEDMHRFLLLCLPCCLKNSSLAEEAKEKMSNVCIMATQQELELSPGRDPLARVNSPVSMEFYEDVTRVEAILIAP